MSKWEERRRRTWEYYLCLALFNWPILLIPFQLLFAAPTLTPEVLMSYYMYSLLVFGFMIGCGVRYRSRGINPTSRNPIDSVESFYVQSLETSRMPVKDRRDRFEVRSYDD
ncbi:MAG: hypothetical protein ACXAB5_07715 [Candidatus Thorarchaeota archaeon]